MRSDDRHNHKQLSLNFDLLAVNLLDLFQLVKATFLSDFKVVNVLFSVVMAISRLSFVKFCDYDLPPFYQITAAAKKLRTKVELRRSSVHELRASTE